MAARLTFSVLAFAFLFSLALATSFDENKIIYFSYMGSNGPDKWGSLSPHFSACSTGKSQSPVNIVKADAIINKDLKPLTRKYQRTKAVLINNGFNIGMHFDGNVGVLSLSGKNYTLKQMHWHTPSEHQLDGVQYPAELHQVHIADDDGSLSVVSTLYKYGKSDPIVSKINRSLEKLAKEVLAGHEEAQIRVGSLHTKLLKRNTHKYYRYIGSLTTPPCSENVTWNILGKVGTISKEQVAALKAPLDLPYKNNSRPVQPLNSRRVQIYNELDN